MYRLQNTSIYNKIQQKIYGALLKEVFHVRALRYRPTFLVTSGVNLVLNLGVVDPGKNSIFQANYRKISIFPGTNFNFSREKFQFFSGKFDEKFRFFQARIFE